MEVDGCTKSVGELTCADGGMESTFASVLASLVGGLLTSCISCSEKGRWRGRGGGAAGIESEVSVEVSSSAAWSRWTEVLDGAGEWRCWVEQVD